MKALQIGLVLLLASTASARMVKLGKWRNQPAVKAAAGLVATSTQVVDLTKVPNLVEADGIWFNRATLHSYVYRCPPDLGWGAWDKRDCATAVDTGYTFENATWRSGISDIFHLQWPWLNPLDFGTADTARTVLKWVEFINKPYSDIVWSINDTAGAITGPFSRTTYWSVCGDDNRQVNCFSAGQIANKLIRNNPEWSKASWLAEVKSAWSR